MERNSIIWIPGNRKKDSSIQVLHVHKDSYVGATEDNHLSDGTYICHALLSQTLKQESWIDGKQIDAVIVEPDCLIADIKAIREMTTREMVPLILYTINYEWKAKEIALESGVDEYHTGTFDQNFIKRIRLIRKTKSFLDEKKSKQSLDEARSFKFAFVKRLLDIVTVSLITIFLLPVLMVIIPLLIIETKGSILNSSKRVGKNYKTFDLYKFRCISSGDSKKLNLIRFFLQKTHLVGLPQLLNILMGDMSFIGNYPVHEAEAEKLTKDGMASRFLVPVGLIGLWRFNATDKKSDPWYFTKSDMEYAIIGSIWLDFRILLAHLINIAAVQNMLNKGLMFISKTANATSVYKESMLSVGTN